MKKMIYILFSAVLLLSSCKKNADNSQQEKPQTEIATEATNGLTTVSGEFLYMADAAVLNTGQKVYGVTINEKMHELNGKVKLMKKEDFDMIPVTVRGTISKKPEGQEGWPEIIDIKEIVSVSPATNADETIIIKSEE